MVFVMAQDPILTQLKRIRGQVDGVINMYQDGRECVDIVHQVVAIHNSLGKVARKLLTSEVSSCSREKRLADLDAVLKEIFKY